jgi:hypothetical protein
MIKENRPDPVIWTGADVLDHHREGLARPAGFEPATF